MGCLIALGPTVAALAVMFLLLPVNPLISFVVSTAVWLALSLKFWGGGSAGDGRYDGAGGPFDIG